MTEDVAEQVEVQIGLSKNGKVVYVRDKDGKDAEFLALQGGRPEGNVLHCEPMMVIITEVNPCYAWYCTSRGCWKVRVPC